MFCMNVGGEGGDGNEEIESNHQLDLYSLMYVCDAVLTILTINYIAAICI